MSDVREEARRLAHQANAAGLRLRLIGSLGVREHCGASEEVLEIIGRPAPRDIDFVAESRQERDIVDLFKRLEYQPDPAVAYSREYGVQRLIYHHPEAPIKVDVFLDVLHMAHSVDFRNRLPEGRSAVAVTDLLLAKLQIHEFTERDLQDLLAILGAHTVGREPYEDIDLDRLHRVLGDDWGFSHSASQNLLQLRRWAEHKKELPGSLREKTIGTAEELGAEIMAGQKSLRWRLRSAVGTRVRWYEEVEEVER